MRQIHGKTVIERQGVVRKPTTPRATTRTNPGISGPATEGIDPDRRLHCRSLVAAALGAGGSGLFGCGGSNDSDNSGTDNGNEPPFPSTPNPSTGTTTGDVPPSSGAFGGGQGKILFVVGGNRPKEALEVDLASRQLRSVASIQGSVFRAIAGGVTRAHDGSFLIVDYEVTGPSSQLLHHAPDGALIRTVQTGRALGNGAAISPDARQAAYIDTVYLKVSDSYPFYRDALRLFLADLQTGDSIYTDLMAPQEEPSDKSDISTAAIYTPDGQLYVLASNGLYRYNPTSNSTTRLHTPDIGDPYDVVSSPDGASLWFQQERGNPYGATIWSIDIASGALTRRSIRSRSGGQYAPAFSPDQQWLLLQETSLIYLGSAISSYYYVCAVRNAAEPLDTEDLRTAILDRAGKGMTASGRMCWY